MALQSPQLCCIHTKSTINQTDIHNVLAKCVPPSLLLNYSILNLWELCQHVLGRRDGRQVISISPWAAFLSSPLCECQDHKFSFIHLCHSHFRSRIRWQTLLCLFVVIFIPLKILFEVFSLFVLLKITKRPNCKSATLKKNDVIGSLSLFLMISEWRLKRPPAPALSLGRPSKKRLFTQPSNHKSRLSLRAKNASCYIFIEKFFQRN